jgi:hypothetical protein
MLALLALLLVGHAQAGALRNQIEDAARRNFAEYLELLRHRNVANVPADIERNAQFLQAAFERRGLRARLVPNAAGRPVVLAELAGAAPGLPTMLLTALDLLAERNGARAFGLKVMLDGEEEMGSPSLAATIAVDAAAFRADALVILDGPVHVSGRPTLVFGNRGSRKRS